MSHKEFKFSKYIICIFTLSLSPVSRGKLPWDCNLYMILVNIFVILQNHLLYITAAVAFKEHV